MTLHSSPVRVRYVVSFVCSSSEKSWTFHPFVLCSILRYIRPQYIESLWYTQEGLHMPCMFLVFAFGRTTKSFHDFTETIFRIQQCFYPLKPDDAWNMSTLVQMMASRLNAAKWLSETMLNYCPMDPKEHISVKIYFKFKKFQGNTFINESATCPSSCRDLIFGAMWYGHQRR